MAKRVPNIFYRFRSFSEATLDLLCHDSLHFANPSTFNDPLDCKPSLDPDSTVEELRELLATLVKQRVQTEMIESLKRARIGGDRAQIHAHKGADNEASRILSDVAYHATNPEYDDSPENVEIKLLRNKIHDELARYYERGVCSFSSTYSNPLLWSHYGDQHQGLCIGYDLVRNPQPVMRKVIYGGNRIIKTSTLVAAILRDDQRAREKLEKDMLLRKARCWEYEAEWRLIGKQGIQDSPLRLKEITFGLRCPSSIIYTVVTALRNRKQPIKFFEMYVVRDSYRLGRKVPNFEELHLYMPRTAESAEEALETFKE